MITIENLCPVVVGVTGTTGLCLTNSGQWHLDGVTNIMVVTPGTATMDLRSAVDGSYVVVDTFGNISVASGPQLGLACSIGLGVSILCFGTFMVIRYLVGVFLVTAARVPGE